jgi:hypothetical protein
MAVLDSPPPPDDLLGAGAPLLLPFFPVAPAGWRLKILDTITSDLSRPQALVAFTRRLAPVDNNEVRVATPLEAGHETSRHIIPLNFQSNLTKCLLGHYHLLFWLSMYNTQQG